MRGSRFDFAFVENQIKKAYRMLDPDFYHWELEEYIDFFNRFYQAYKILNKKDHPILSTMKILEVMEELPYYDGTYYSDGDDCGNWEHCGREHALILALAYFKTKMNCDHSIVHFVSGKIRRNRSFELQI